MTASVGAGGGTSDGRDALVDEFVRARADGDHQAMLRIAVDLPSLIGFGTHPGGLPAMVHEAYTLAADPADRARLAAAMARVWAYSYDFDRARSFATEAVAVAEPLPDRALLADALDTLLLIHWGPDDFDARLRIAARLDDTVAHVSDPEARLSAHLWRLTTAWECLDVVAVQRQLRALDVLAAESGLARMAFFAAARRATYAVVSGDLDQADVLHERMHRYGTEANETDLMALHHTLAVALTRQRGDVDGMRDYAPFVEAHGMAEGVQSIAAEGAVLWLDAGEHDAARSLLHKLVGAGLDAVPRDVDFLLTVTCLLDVAVGVGDEVDIVADGYRLLEPYAGRAVINAGGVMFHGVVDDHLYQAASALGREDADRFRHAAEAAYKRFGAPWWTARIAAFAPPRTNGRRQPSSLTTAHLHRDRAGTWTVGYAGATVNLPDLKGLHYLRALLERPGADVPALDLAAAADGHAGTTIDSDAGELIDPQALAAYRRRLRDIDAELDDARDNADRGRVDRLTLERDALLDEVKAATGLGSRTRVAKSTAERARVSVRKAVAAALDRVNEHDPALARLLRDTVHTGTACRYDPDPARPVSWVLA